MCPPPEAGVVQSVLVEPGDAVATGAALAKFKPGAAAEVAEEVAEESSERADLAEVMQRHYVGTDVARPEAVAKRHARGHRTARENIADLIDEGSFIEYGPLAIAAQRRRREVAELIERTPADGMVAMAWWVVSPTVNAGHLRGGEHRVCRIEL